MAHIQPVKAKRLNADCVFVGLFFLSVDDIASEQGSSKSATIEMYAPSSYNETVTGETLSSISEKSATYSHPENHEEYIVRNISVLFVCLTYRYTWWLLLLLHIISCPIIQNAMHAASCMLCSQHEKIIWEKEYLIIVQRYDFCDTSSSMAI